MRPKEASLQNRVTERMDAYLVSSRQPSFIREGGITLNCRKDSNGGKMMGEANTEYGFQEEKMGKK